jgi:hypothetical protein
MQSDSGTAERAEEAGRTRRRPLSVLATLLAAAALGLGAVGVAGCGDEDNEGIAEEAGKAIDEGAQEAKDAADDVDVDVDTTEDGQRGDNGKRKKK